MSEIELTVIGASHPSAPDVSKVEASGSLLAMSRDELKALFREKRIRWRGPIEFMSRRAGERQGFKPGTERSFFRCPAMDKDPTGYWMLARRSSDGHRLLVRVNLSTPVPEFN